MNPGILRLYKTNKHEKQWHFKPKFTLSLNTVHWSIWTGNFLGVVIGGLFKVCAIRILYTGRSISRGHAKLTLNGLQYRFVLQRLILYIRINNRPGVLCWRNCWFTRKVILKLNIFIIIVFRHLGLFFYSLFILFWTSSTLIVVVSHSQMISINTTEETRLRSRMIFWLKL